MKRLILIITFFLIIYSSPTAIFAANYNDPCSKSSECPFDSQCQIKPNKQFYCSPQPSANDPISIFGKVLPPSPVEDLGIGSGGISKFVNMLIILIYILAGVVFVFMILWGAFQFLTSGGNKESLDSARKRIIYALIGITLLAIAFAILKVVGLFTGFTFSLESNSPTCPASAYPEVFYRDGSKCIHKIWRDNVPYSILGSPTLRQCAIVFVEVESRFCP